MHACCMLVRGDESVIVVAVRAVEKRERGRERWDRLGE